MTPSNVDAASRSKRKASTRDPVCSSQAYFVQVNGLRWLACMVLLPLSWANRVWALPFLTVLCPSERFYEQRGRRHQTLTEGGSHASRDGGSCT